MSDVLMQIWVFNGANSMFPAGVFTKREVAESWIKKYHLTGVLTAYHLDVGVYDWALENGSFVPKKDSEKESGFIQKFSSASQVHFHYEDGKID